MTKNTTSAVLQHHHHHDHKCTLFIYLFIMIIIVFIFKFMIIICSNNFEWVFFFFPQFLACSQTGVIPQQDLAKFGYKPTILL
jgi:hypothetical protein